ncbi:hypothetical protein Y032_0175g513 [Ancylostoma ceylanicum]|uniref:Uncharacterized protein n=1 Tax=Ancylostoma ceylanicum TaxID=53326 RepID=A0A016SUR5_9BILA|nr:hypothetical protein Y032_0175g513 [Ancylostoma ceylanicum]
MNLVNFNPKRQSYVSAKSTKPNRSDRFASPQGYPMPQRLTTTTSKQQIVFPGKMTRIAGQETTKHRRQAISLGAERLPVESWRFRLSDFKALNANLLPPPVQHVHTDQRRWDAHKGALKMSLCSSD